MIIPQRPSLTSVPPPDVPDAVDALDAFLAGCPHVPEGWPCRDCDSPIGEVAEPPAVAGTTPPGRSRLRHILLDRAALARLPEPQPLIEGTLDLRTVALLAGYWGTGKSFLALDWAACVATGKPWQGRAAEQGPVLYIAGEGAYGLNNRLTAWERAWNTTISPDMFQVIPSAVALGRDSDVHALVDIAGVLNPRLVVVDTVARCAVGLDENSARDMGMFVHALDRVRAALTTGTVLALHHTGKDKVTVRGSSALEGAADTVYKVEGEPDRLALERTKRKDGPLGDRLMLAIESVPGTGSAVLSRVRGTADTSTSATKLMSAFMSAFASTGASKAELRHECGLASSSFHRALNSCLESGYLVNHGSDARPFYKVGESYA